VSGQRLLLGIRLPAELADKILRLFLFGIENDGFLLRDLLNGVGDLLGEPLW